jgi:hypothetical protein
MRYQERENGRTCDRMLDCTAEAVDPHSLLPAVGAQIDDARPHPTTARHNLCNTLQSIIHGIGICHHNRCDPLN